MKKIMKGNDLIGPDDKNTVVNRNGSNTEEDLAVV